MSVIKLTVEIVIGDGQNKKAGILSYSGLLCLDQEFCVAKKSYGENNLFQYNEAVLSHLSVRGGDVQVRGKVAGFYHIIV